MPQWIIWPFSCTWPIIQHFKIATTTLVRFRRFWVPIFFSRLEKRQNFKAMERGKLQKNFMPRKETKQFTVHGTEGQKLIKVSILCFVVLYGATFCKNDAEKSCSRCGFSVIPRKFKSFSPPFWHRCGNARKQPQSYENEWWWLHAATCWFVNNNMKITRKNAHGAHFIVHTKLAL